MLLALNLLLFARLFPQDPFFELGIPELDTVLQKRSHWGRGEGSPLSTSWPFSFQYDPLPWILLVFFATKAYCWLKASSWPVGHKDRGCRVLRSSSPECHPLIALMRVVIPPRYEILHFLLLNLITFLSDQHASLSTPGWIAAQPSGLSETFYHQQTCSMPSSR